MMDAGDIQDLHDSEYERMLDEIGKRVVSRRHELTMTQEELAKKSGLSLTTIHRVENGESAPHLETILKLCETLKCSSDYLLGLRIRNYDDVMQDANFSG